MRFAPAGPPTPLLRVCAVEALRRNVDGRIRATVADHVVADGVGGVYGPTELCIVKTWSIAGRADHALRPGAAINRINVVMWRGVRGVDLCVEKLSLWA